MAARRRTTRRTSTSTRSASTRSSSRSSSTTRAAKPAPVMPVAGPGERIHVLAVPYELRQVAQAYGGTWNAAVRQALYVGKELPHGLAPFASPDYSWERWIEDDLNGHVKPCAPSTVRMTPRTHQQTAIDKIESSALRGYRGFIEADDVGLGKTISAWVGALRVARQRGARNILVMCPKGVLPHWRRTIAAVGDDGLRICVINYDRSKKLLAVPKSAEDAKRTRTKNARIAAQGTSLVDWDVILLDESHKLKNEGSQRRAAAARIARYAEAAKTAPYVIWMSATVGQNPVELGYMAPLLAQLTGSKKSDLADFGQWLADQGFCVTFNTRFKKWEWGVIPDDASPSEVARIAAHKQRDLERIHQLLFAGPDAPSIRRLPTDIAGWPEILRIPYPVELDADARRMYEQAWTSFRSELNLARRGRDPKGGRAARTRFRQKASLLRVPGTVDLALDLLDNGHQVAISVEFHETLDAIRDALAAARVSCAEYSGRNDAVREAERVAFQRGQHRVVLFTVAEGISLHQRELLPDGTHASDVSRTTIVHDPRYSGIESIQIEGRCHRDGQNANVYYTFGAGTVEQQIVSVLLDRVISTKTMVGDDVTVLKMLEATLDAAAGVETAGEEPAVAGGSASGGVAPAARASAPPSLPRGGGLPTVRPATVTGTQVRRAAASASPPTTSARSASAPVARPAAAPPAAGAPRRATGLPPVPPSSGKAGEPNLRDALAGGHARQVQKPRWTAADERAFKESLRRTD